MSLSHVLWFERFSYFPQKIGLDISIGDNLHEMSILFAGEKKKKKKENYFRLSSAEILAGRNRVL